MVLFSPRQPRRRVAGAVAGLVALSIVGVPTRAAASPQDPPMATPPQGALTTERALAQARRTGTAVPVEAASTATDTVTANPDGTVTMARTASPTRKRVGGGWRDLDATLRRNDDASISPTVATNGLRLSGGGPGPMATMSSAGLSVAFTAPAPLPAPVLDGDTATYPDVLPDVDLVVTADRQGGFSHVFVVHTPLAAANPALRELTLPTDTTGVAMSADAQGNVAGTDRTGRTVLTAPAPKMWDATPAPQRLSDTGPPTEDSTVDGPGTAARVAPVAVSIDGEGMRLRPDAGLLTGADTTFPVYIDPTFTWSATGAANNGWATVAQQYPSDNHWKSSPDPAGRMQVGNGASILSRTLVNFPIATSTLAGATINTAKLDITETRAWSCNARVVNLYAPSATLTASNATWNYWNGVSWGGIVDAKNVAHGYNSSCPAKAVSFDVKAEVAAAVGAGKKTQTFLLAAGDESDNFAWKEFLETSPRLTVTYNHKPNKPTGMSTSPATSCAAATPTTVGDGQVTLYAPVSDRNGGVLGVRFNLWKTSTPGTILASSDPNLLTYASGGTAVLVVPVSTLRTAANGAITQFSWRVQATDFNQTSDWSTTCNFRFDPTRTGPPTVSQPADGASMIGQSVTVTVTPPTSGATPTGYLYQLNGGPPGTVTATSGNATVTVTPTRFTNTLTVTGLSAGGNVGDTAAVTFNSTPAVTAPDADLTGDGTADLLTVGATNNLPSGMWLAAGKNTGQVVAAANNIGANGNGAELTSSPAAFNGAQLVTGHFSGTGLQDILAYYPNGYPNTGDNAGGGVILRGNGDGSPIQAQLSGIHESIWAGALSDLYGLNPRQIANAGASSGLGGAYPDLIGIGGDDSVGYYLSYYANQGSANNWQFPALLGTPTPTGGYDWNTWTIATAQTSTGTAMFLWQRGTGALHLWTNLAFNANEQTFSYTARTIAASGWNTGKALSLVAADIDGNGTADLWTVGAAAAATAHLTSNLTGTGGTITAQPVQPLSTATHTWLLNDATDATVGANAAKDTVASLHASGAGNTAWNTGDLFDPDVVLDGSGDVLTTAGPAVTTNADFSLSVWVKPAAAGGTVLSQDGGTIAGFRLWAESADKSWRFAMPRSDSTSATWDTAATVANTVRLGVWTNLTVTYSKSSGVMNLYANGAKITAGTHTTTWAATGGLRVGAHKTGASSYTGYLNGHLSTVKTWNQVIDPAQAATPAGYYQPITQTRFMDTRNGTGGTTGPLAHATTAKLKIAGVGGIPTSNVTGVAINVTVTAATGGGHIDVYPDNTPKPLTSTVNYLAGATVANSAITPVGANGYIALYVHSGGTVQILVDVAGYFTSDSTKTANTSYTPVTPTRIMDTRSGVGVPAGKLAGGSTTTLQVGGVGGVPTTVTAVAMNFTAVSATANSFLVTYADGTTRPAVSGLQFPPTDATAGLAIVPVGTNGKIAIYTPTGQTDLIGDIIGYFTAGTGGLKYHPVNFSRMIETRLDGGPVPADTVKKLAQGNTVIASDPSLILNITVVGPTGTGYLTAYPDGTARPDTSNLDFVTGQTIANLAIADTGGGTTNIYNKQGSGQSTHIVIDCLGYFAAS